MTATQAKIEKEKNAASIICAIKQFELNSPEKVQDFLCVSVSKVESGLDWLVSKNYIWRTSSGMLIITESGFEYIDGLSRRPGFETATSAAKHKEEALSGIVERRSNKSGFTVSRQSTMNRAVVLGGKEKHETKTPEDRFLMNEEARISKIKFAEQLGIKVEDIPAHLEAGRIKKCKRCCNVELHGKKGKYIREICNKCRRKKR